MLNFLKPKNNISEETYNSMLSKFDLDMNFDQLVSAYQSDSGESFEKSEYFKKDASKRLMDFFTGLTLYDSNKTYVVDWKEEEQLPEKPGYKYVEYDTQGDSQGFYVVRNDVEFSPEEKQLLRVI